MKEEEEGEGEGEPSPSPSSNVALIVGVTGMVGLSLARTLHPSWTVFGLARRPPNPSTLIPLHRFIQLDVLDRPLTLRTLSPLAPHVTHLFWVTLSESDDDVSNSRMLTNVLDSLTSSSSFSSALRHVSLQTGTKHYYWGHLSHPNPSFKVNQLVPFKEALPRNPCKLFYYDLEDILVNYSRSHHPSLTWTVHRASIILGASHRSLYNVLLTLAVYALICRHERAPLLYPGSAYTWHHFCDASDADLVAEQHVWAGTANPGSAARFEAFNCANGDVFTWRSFWMVLCEIFHVEFVECGSDGGASDWVGRMEGKGGVWDEIVREEGLHVTKLEEITCFGAVYCILNFDFQHVSCMNKSREFGFVRSVDSLKSVRKWVQRLGEMNVIPKV